jgi:membrane protein DedA with SNARE-associated domain
MGSLQKIAIGSAVFLIIILGSGLYFYNPELFGSLNDLDNLSTENFSPLAIFVIIAISTFFSEDIACLTAGTLAAQGRIGLALGIGACFVGIFLGDVLLYLFGRIGGTAILRMKLVRRFISERTLEKAKRFLEKYGIWAVFLSRFTPGLRLPTYVLAGILQTSLWKFTLFFFLATAFWTPILVGGSAWLGKEFFEISFFENNFLLGLIVFVAVLFVVIKIGLKLTTWRNRRIFRGQIKRRFYWEFWSLKVFYFPVALYVLWLSLKHRGLNTFTATNPAIFASGFIGESKAEILAGLEGSEPAKEFLLKYTLLRNDEGTAETLEKAKNFIEDNDLSFPIALKPDIGERGKDAGFVRDFAELKELISEMNEDLILQEFAGVEEFSVFYYRYPLSKKGHIFSITEKKFPEVTGDGESTLEELILNDKRAICLAKSYLSQNEEELEKVLKSGERKKIIDIGTHSRGAIFLDGERVKTPELEKRIDQICCGFEGFYFGRFDLRTPSVEDLKRGENFKIIELNGVSSESTNIYDPKHSLFGAYKILFKQWRIAFEIGAENIRRGAKTLRLSELIMITFENLQKNKKVIEPEEVNLVGQIESGSSAE